MPSPTNSRELQTPKGYLSWTQFDTIEHSERRYIERYILGLPARPTREQEFGKRIAEVLEGVEDGGDVIIDLLRATIERYDTPEAALETVLTSGGRSIKLIGLADSMDSKTNDFLEYKTGKIRWTQTMANRHGQLLFYKTIVWNNTKQLVKSKLIWAETQDVLDEESGVLRSQLTGRVETFTVDHSLADILTMSARIMRVASRVEEIYRAEIEKTFST